MSAVKKFDNGAQALPVSGKAIGLYVALALALAWVVTLPIWLMEIDLSPTLPAVKETGDPGSGPMPTEEEQFTQTLVAQACGIAMMFTPGIAAVITLLVSGVKFSRVFPLLGASRPVDVPGFGPRVAGNWPYVRRLLMGLVATLGVSLLIALVITIATPVWPANGHTLAHQSASALGIPLALFLVLQFAQIPLGAIFNALPAVGEELGWRGYLYPALTQRFGFMWAVVIGGAIWGLWHAPMIMMGYNFGLFGLPGVALMMVSCMGLGALFAYLYGASGSIWVPALAHGLFNAAAGITLLFWPAGTPFNGVIASALGVWSLVVLLPLGVALVWRVARYSGPAEKSGQNDLQTSGESV